MHTRNDVKAEIITLTFASAAVSVRVRQAANASSMATDSADGIADVAAAPLLGAAAVVLVTKLPTRLGSAK